MRSRKGAIGDDNKTRRPWKGGCDDTIQDRATWRLTLESDERERAVQRVGFLKTGVVKAEAANFRAVRVRVRVDDVELDE